jgi:hypothetical protein
LKVIASIEEPELIERILALRWLARTKRPRRWGGHGESPWRRRV